MTTRELRTLRRQWRKTIREAGRLTRQHYPYLAQRAYDRADDIERRIHSLADELEAAR